MKRILHATEAVLAVLLASAYVHAEGDYGGRAQGEAFSAGEPSDSKKPARIPQVTITEADGKMLFAPNRIEITKDEQVKFMLRNSGELDHEFVLAITGENF